MKELYEIIFKRKSMRRFDPELALGKAELAAVMGLTERLCPLVEGIKVQYRIVEKSRTTAKRGQYCLLLYSEQQPHYLLNAGYLLAQMDLLLAARNIGACWLGLAKPAEMECEGLPYVIMLSFGKSRPQDFRSGAKEFRRKQLGAVWSGVFDPEVAAAARLAPSACNSQPWRFTSAGGQIQVYRNPHAKSFIPPGGKRRFFNSIDLGISLCFLDIALLHGDYAFNRTLAAEEETGPGLIKIAEYQISRPLKYGQEESLS